MSKENLKPGGNQGNSEKMAISRAMVTVAPENAPKRLPPGRDAADASCGIMAGEFHWYVPSSRDLEAAADDASGCTHSPSRPSARWSPGRRPIQGHGDHGGSRPALHCPRVGGWAKGNVDQAVSALSWPSEGGTTAVRAHLAICGQLTRTSRRQPTSAQITIGT